MRTERWEMMTERCEMRKRCEMKTQRWEMRTQRCERRSEVRN
jgi:hypothetical protein